MVSSLTIRKGVVNEKGYGDEYYVCFDAHN